MKRHEEENDWTPALSTETTLRPHISPWTPAKESLDHHQDQLYDASADDQDEHYVNERYRLGDHSTDAVLCCPGCFTPLSYQCQQHQKYRNQFRALSYLNCRPSATPRRVSPPSAVDSCIDQVGRVGGDAKTTATSKRVRHSKRQLAASCHTAASGDNGRDSVDTNIGAGGNGSSGLVVAVDVYDMICDGCGAVVGCLDGDVVHFCDVLPGEP
eukprot:GHVS01045831.1.p2 GENE.GHVS01045831.1~~GHVS01045831.1.p2  ORF type:complete len:213 (+),score=37.67 GHVS01045831.1:170-808(+)